MNILIDKSLKTKLPGARFAWTLYEDVRITASGASLLQALTDEQDRTAKSMNLQTVAQDAAVAQSRRAFKTLGLDPARYRPSQEALLRRILKGQPVTPINAAVDVCNILSIRFKVPMGLYNADCIDGDPVLKVAAEEDTYAALNGRDVACCGLPILADRQGPIGSAYVDSRRTAVDESCRRCLHVVYFCPMSLGEDAFRVMMDTVSSFLSATAQPYKLIQT